MKKISVILVTMLVLALTGTALADVRTLAMAWEDCGGATEGSLYQGMMQTSGSDRIGDVSIGSAATMTLQYGDYNATMGGLFLALCAETDAEQLAFMQSSCIARYVNLVESELYCSSEFGQSIVLEYYRFALRDEFDGSSETYEALFALYAEEDGGEVCSCVQLERRTTVEAAREEEPSGSAEEPQSSTSGAGSAEEPACASARFWQLYPDYVSFFGAGYPEEYIDGWTMGRYLFDAGSCEMQVANCDEYVSLRAEADSDTERLCRVPLGDVVDASGELNGWVLCSYNGRYGWIKLQYLEWY